MKRKMLKILLVITFSLPIVTLLLALVNIHSHDLMIFGVDYIAIGALLILPNFLFFVIYFLYVLIKHRTSLRYWFKIPLMAVSMCASWVLFIGSQ